MILLCGIPTESPLEMVTNALRQLRVHHFVFNQRQVADMHIEYELDGGTPQGWIESGNELYQLVDFEGVYLRLMDDRYLPEMINEPEDSVLISHSRSVHDNLLSWLEVTEARVVNRPSAMASNNSKPYQAQLIRRHGLRVPDTLITNDPDLVHEFRSRHGQVIYKSISGVRSIVRTLEDGDLVRLEKIRWCPTQFQEFVSGDNVRVHVVGDRIFATRIYTDATDYRYAQAQVGKAAMLEAFDLNSDIAEKCISLSRSLQLPFAGVDLKVTPDGDVYCFEVNPCPGFSYFEANTGQPIALAVAEYLSGTSENNPVRQTAAAGDT